MTVDALEIEPVPSGTIEARVRAVLAASMELLAADEVALECRLIQCPLLHVVRRGSAAPSLEAVEQWRETFREERERIAPGPPSDGGRRYVTKLRAERDGELFGQLGVRLANDPKGAAELAFAGLGALVAAALENIVLQDAAQRAEDRCGMMQKVVSHDLRSPLNTVSLGVGWLRASGVAGTSGPMLDRMERAVAHINHLIADLVDRRPADSGDH